MNTHALATQPRNETTPAAAAERLSRYISKLADAGFFGKVIVSFQKGKVCDVRVEEVKKLDEI